MALKILVGTIFSDVKDYVIRDWYKNVCQFTYPGFDVCAVDNSKDKKYHKKIGNYFQTHSSRSHINLCTVLHTPRIHRRSEVFMAFSANYLRKFFLDNNYDVLIYKEADVLTPPDIIERLLSYNKHMVSALFFTGHKRNSYPMMLGVNVYSDGPKMALRSYLQGFYDIGETEIPKQIASAGLGCVLMYRETVQQIPFRAAETFSHHHDSTFTQDLYQNDIPNFYVPIICKHENQPWDIQRKMIGNQK